jgi:LmbE family N-acetylglucosaminyl deacetylase
MLALSAGGGKLGSILCLGAHCDDIEIGCGASILRLVRENPGVHVTWVVLSSTPGRTEEATQAADRFLSGTKHKTVKIEAFRDSYFPYSGAEIKDYIHALSRTVQPDLILTHYRGDAHQDHRLVSELTGNAFRDHLILEYEIPKYDGDLGAPNFFIPVDRELCESKVDVIYECFGSQRSRSWFTKDTFWAILRLRGIEANSASGYAEGFYARKCVY